LTAALAHELGQLRQHGVEVAYRPEAGGYACVAETDEAGFGRTNVRAVFTCGDVTGFVGPARAAELGARAGAAAARSLLQERAERAQERDEERGA